MAEWSNAAVLKTVVPRGTGGSNPSLSAKGKTPNDLSFGVLFFSGAKPKLVLNFAPGKNKTARC